MNIEEKIEKAAKEYAPQYGKDAFSNRFKECANLLLPDYERVREALRNIKVEHRLRHGRHIEDYVTRELETIKDLL